ncbi:hypothetical protein PVAND_008475 [Polypedilum vanderplanki]|uniref:Secreted protein n=1 Tax=Polypedilum vanderplanki TaxID=319348 RepID=A0A9J6C9W1_POLVA|nr:hypothetical protein PVAND_008475 [Polypedilum vanderplanki]
MLFIAFLCYNIANACWCVETVKENSGVLTIEQSNKIHLRMMYERNNRSELAAFWRSNCSFLHGQKLCKEGYVCRYYPKAQKFQCYDNW